MNSMNILTFDIETIPDTLSGRRVYGLEGLSDDDIAKAMFAKQLQKASASDFLPLHFHKIVAISTVLRTRDSLQVWSLGTADSTESELIQRFYDGIEKYSPTLVSWNGGGFDLPVLHYRSLLNHVVASRYWDNGEGDREFKFNNYLSRYHWRHIDLMDVLAGFNFRAAAPLDQIAVMLGFPGKMGLSGAAVWTTYQAGGIEEIRQYCEIDALNTYLVYLKWELIRGNATEQQYADECQRVRELLKASNSPHFDAFLNAWS